jgi:hypothetical protein
MADPGQLRILLQGVEAWNAWRRFPWSCRCPASRSRATATTTSG